MSKLKLFMHPLSQPARALMMFLRANSIPHEDVLVDLGRGEQLKDEYAKNVNPLKKIPVINHDGFILTESVAILRYLTRAFPVPDHWFPNDSAKQARVDEYLEWQHFNIRMNGTLFFMEKYVEPLKTKQPPNEKRAATFLERFQTCVGQVETYFLKDQPFIAGQKISIADLLAASEMEQTALGGYDVKDHHPKIRDYIERVRDQLQPHYDEVHSVLFSIGKKIKEKSNS